jgi:hypothetical protein
VAKYELKTKKNSGSVSAFLDSVADTKRREDAKAVLALMKRVTKRQPKMWGTSIVGFGEYHYKNRSGIEADWPLTGFSPRKATLTIYIMPGFAQYKKLMKQLGIYKTGSSCLYVKRLSDIDTAVLEKLVRASVKEMEKKYATK